MRTARLMLGAVFALLVLALVVGAWLCRPQPAAEPPARTFQMLPAEPEAAPSSDSPENQGRRP